jgi:hypothetical protein
MQKAKSNARWTQLSVKRRDTLDKWLFEEKMSYAAILPRAKAELGFKGGMSSLKRYCARRQKERALTEFTELRNEVAAISGAPGNANELRSASMKLLGRFFFHRVRAAPENVKDWAPVASLLVQNDHNEVLRESKAEEIKLRREQMEFAKQKFQFDTVERALNALPQLQALAESRRNPETRRYEENRHWNKVLRRMFGAWSKVYPENAREEAEMLAAKKEREARREQEAQAERITEAGPPAPSSPYYQEYVAEKARLEEEKRMRYEKYAQEGQREQGEARNEHEEGEAEREPEGEPRKPSRQYQEYLDRLKLWEEQRETLGWEEVPRPEWSGKWPMFEEEPDEE